MLSSHSDVEGTVSGNPSDGDLSASSINITNSSSVDMNSIDVSEVSSQVLESTDVKNSVGLDSTNRNLSSSSVDVSDGGGANVDTIDIGEVSEVLEPDSHEASGSSDVGSSDGVEASLSGKVGSSSAEDIEIVSMSSSSEILERGAGRGGESEDWCLSMSCSRDHHI